MALVKLWDLMMIFALRHLGKVFVMVVLASTAASTAAEITPLIADCDRLGASTYDPTLPPKTLGVSFDDIDAGAAITKCRIATETIDSGDNSAPRMWFNYARALHKAGRGREALEFYRKAAQSGHILSHNNIGALLEDGSEQINKDEAAAYEHYSKASEGGIAFGTYNLARMVQYGRGAPKDEALALTLFERAASAGHLAAHERAAKLLEAGVNGGSPNDAAAAEHWRTYASAGNRQASYRLAQLLQKGSAEARDKDEAMRNLAIAADADIQDAAYDLAKTLSDAPSSNKQMALTYAYKSYDIARNAPIESEDGWIMHQFYAGRLIVRLVMNSGTVPRSLEEFAQIKGDFSQETLMKYTVPTTCEGGVKTPYSVYAWDWSRNYNPISPQLDWIEKARSCKVDNDVKYSFIELFNIAREKNVSFANLLTDSLDGKPEDPNAKKALLDCEMGSNADIVINGCSHLIDSNRINGQAPTDEQLALVHKNRGEAHFNIEQYEPALSDFQQAIRRDPALAVAYADRGAIHYIKKDYKAAIADTDQAIKLDPTLPKSYFYRALAQEALGNFSEAISDYTRVIESNPENKTALFNRGALYLGQGE
jgi:TPR repeat protein